MTEERETQEVLRLLVLKWFDSGILFNSFIVFYELAGLKLWGNLTVALLFGPAAIFPTCSPKNTLLRGCSSPMQTIGQEVLKNLSKAKS